MAGTTHPLFLGQNYPCRMTSLDYARDTQATGLDQIARIALWARESAKIVDSPYAPTFRPIVTPTPTARIEDDVGEAADA